MDDNEDIEATSTEREFDINVDAQYESEGEDAGRVDSDATADNIVSVINSHLQPSGKRNAAGKWGSTFWKDCQPMGDHGVSDSGHDSKSQGR